MRGGADGSEWGGRRDGRAGGAGDTGAPGGPWRGAPSRLALQLRRGSASAPIAPSRTSSRTGCRSAEVRRHLRVGHALPLLPPRWRLRCDGGPHPCHDERVGERRVPSSTRGRAGPDAPSRLRAWPTTRSDRTRPAARESAPARRARRLASAAGGKAATPSGSLQPPSGSPSGSLQPPSGTSQWEPAASLWESQWEPAASHWESHWEPGKSQWEPAASHWEVPLGASRAHWEGRVGLSRRDSKRRVGARGLARRPRRVPLAGASGRRALPLGGRATSVRAPLPVRYLPTLGLKSAKDLCFGRREGFLARYERANALPPRPRVGRARVCPFPPLPTALAAVAPPKGRQLGAKCSVARRRRAEHRRSLERGLLRATFAARGRCMHRRGPRRLGSMLSVRTQDTVCISVTTSWRTTLSSA